MVVLDRDERVVFQRRLANDVAVVVGAYTAGIVVASSGNWRVDGLEEAGYRAPLANTWAIKSYEGLKHTDERWEARWLCARLAAWRLAGRRHLAEGGTPGARSVAPARPAWLRAR